MQAPGPSSALATPVPEAAAQAPAPSPDRVTAQAMPAMAVPPTTPAHAAYPPAFKALSYVAWWFEVRRLSARFAKRVTMVVALAGAVMLATFAFYAYRMATVLGPSSEGVLALALALSVLVTASVLVCALSAAVTVARRLCPLEQQQDWEQRLPRQIQTSILPRQLDIEGIEIAAGMRPADHVGGDYYDVIPSPGGCWIGIGDVAGHGLEAGLVMFMVQGIVQALVRADPDASPADVVVATNRTVYANVRLRAGWSQHVTFCLVHYWADGRLLYAGCHEDIMIRRSAGTCESLPTMGTWLGACPEIGGTTQDNEAQLGPGDLMLLYTDGVIETRRSKNDFFGAERLAAVMESQPDLAAALVRDQVMAAVEDFAAPEDDCTLVAVRCQGVFWG
jgi:phosphoserine phosphatase RsbU/P